MEAAMTLPSGVQPAKKIKIGTIIGIGAGVLLLGAGIWAFVYFSDKDKEERAGNTGAGQGKGKGCPTGETYNEVSKICCHPTIARAGCPRAGTGKGSAEGVIAGRGFDGIQFA